MRAAWGEVTDHNYGSDTFGFVIWFSKHEVLPAFVPPSLIHCGVRDVNSKTKTKNHIASQHGLCKENMFASLPCLWFFETHHFHFRMPYVLKQLNVSVCSNKLISGKRSKTEVSSMDFSWPPTNLSHDQCWYTFFFSLEEKPLQHWHRVSLSSSVSHLLCFQLEGTPERGRNGCERGRKCKIEGLPDNRASALIGEQ